MEDSAPVVTAVASALAWQLSVAVIDAKPRFRRLRAGRTLVEQGAWGEELVLLVAGVLGVGVDGRSVTEVGPGAIVGELALLGGPAAGDAAGGDSVPGGGGAQGPHRPAGPGAARQGPHAPPRPPSRGPEPCLTREFALATP